jgi:outer membrane protein assembly factor BamB
VLWQYQTGVEEHFTVAAGNIYVSALLPSHIYRLLALQETTGHMLWGYTGSISSTAQQGGRVYAVSIVWHHLPGGTPQHTQSEGTLLALSAQNGKPLWSSKIAVTFGAIENVGRLIPEQDHLLFFNGSQLCAYRISDGQAPPPEAASGLFALENQTIYTLGGPQSNQLEALDSTTGTVLWSKPVSISQYTQLSLIAIMQNSIYLLAAPEGGTARLYALSLTDGHQLWSYTYPFATQATAAGR